MAGFKQLVWSNYLLLSRRKAKPVKVAFLTRNRLDFLLFETGRLSLTVVVSSRSNFEIRNQYSHNIPGMALSVISASLFAVSRPSCRRSIVYVNLITYIAPHHWDCYIRLSCCLVRFSDPFFSSAHYPPRLHWPFLGRISPTSIRL